MLIKYPWKEIKTAAKNIPDDKPKFVVVGDFATQHLALACQGVLNLEKIQMHVIDTDYDQITAQVLDEHSELYEAKPDIVFIAFCTEKLYEQYCNTPVEERENFAQSKAEYIASLRARITNVAKSKVFQMTWPTINDSTFGNYTCKVESSFPWQLKKLNQLMYQQAKEDPSLQLIDMDAIQLELGRNDFVSDKMYFIARMPYTQNALTLIAQNVASILSAMAGHIRKCVVLDLDNTLWGGVIGDDGLNGIQLGELGLGRAFCSFQSWLKELKNRGVLLAVCSKNNEDIAKEPFEKHPEMILKLDDFAMFVANWENKATNIQHIREKLNIGMDSLVFIDDNPFERNVVRSLIPDICVPELPEDPAEYVSYLRSLNLFETASFSKDDSNRTQLYIERQKSLDFQAAFDNYDDYLKSLEMKATVSKFDPFHYPRIAQLTQRSNQFNLRTGRYTEEQIEGLANDPNVITLWFGLKDKFTDHGLISLVIMDIKDSKTLFIREWLMSCRVLKRGMEEYVADTIVKTAKENGFEKVISEYIPTAKNAMVEHLAEQMGFEVEGDVCVAYPNTYIYHKTFIERECN